jgi:hypothetical protein
MPRKDLAPMTGLELTLDEWIPFTSSEPTGCEAYNIFTTPSFASDLSSCTDSIFNTVRRAWAELAPNNPRVEFLRTATSVFQPLTGFADSRGASIASTVDAKTGLFEQSLSSRSGEHAAPRFLHIYNHGRAGLTEYCLARYGPFCTAVMISGADSPELCRWGSLTLPCVSRYSVQQLVGPTGLSDLRIAENRTHYIQQLASTPVDLVLADCDEMHDEIGFCPDGSCDETRHLEWFAAQLCVALPVLKPGASLVIRLSHVFLPPTVELVWVLHLLFEHTTILRPAACIPGNSECFLTAKGFRGPVPVFARATELVARRLDLYTKQDEGSRTYASPYYTPLLDLARLRSQNEAFRDFTRLFLLPTSAGLVTHRINCLIALRRDDRELLSRLQQTFHAHDPAELPLERFWYGQATPLPAEDLELATAFLAPIARSVLNHTNCNHLLLAALVPSNNDKSTDNTKLKGKQKRQHLPFVFVDSCAVFKLEAPGVNQGQVRVLMEDFASFLPPGFIVEVLSQSRDLHSFKLASVVSTPQEPLLWRRTPRNDRHLLLWMMRRLRPEAQLKLCV